LDPSLHEPGRGNEGRNKSWQGRAYWEWSIRRYLERDEINGDGKYRARERERAKKKKKKSVREKGRRKNTKPRPVHVVSVRVN
jgi:hypothetical protein